MLETTEGGDGHQHRGFRKVQSGNNSVRNREIVRREYELVGPSVVWLDLVGRRHISFQSPEDGGSDGHDLVAGVLGLVDHLAGLVGDDESLGIHPVLGQVFDIHPAELTYAHMLRDESLVDVLEDHPVEQLAAEMRAGGRDRHGPFVLGEYGLVILVVFRSHLVLHPFRNRQFAECEKGILEIIVRTVV